MRAAAIADYGADPARCHAIANGFDTAVFHPRDRTAARATLGLDDGDRVILYVGRFVEAKGLRELVTAFGALLARDPRRRLVLLGDGVMRAALEQLLHDSGLAARTTLPGACEPGGVAQWLAACDVLTLPSWSEGYPNVVVEAVACGRPVVATDVGGTREILDADNGILVPPRDALALERGLEDALTRTWDAVAMAARMRRGWDDVARETLAVCESVLAAAGR
jgi:glycosyltransferase involved in cell wall biosynthesis